MMNQKNRKTSDLKQSYRGYVREHLERIESKIAFGHPQELIRQELAMEGFEASLLTFRDALGRARKWRDGKNRQEIKRPARNNKAQATEVKNLKQNHASPRQKDVTSTDTDRYFARKSMLTRKGS